MASGGLDDLTAAAVPEGVPAPEEVDGEYRHPAGTESGGDVVQHLSPVVGPEVLDHAQAVDGVELQLRGS